MPTVQSYHLEVRSGIIRPLAELKENVAIANLMNRYGLKSHHRHFQPSDAPPLHRQHHILVNCQQTNTVPMPHCATQIVFTTSFIDEIMEQQSQTQPVVIVWPKAPNGLAIIGRISRPEIQHVYARLGPH